MEATDLAVELGALAKHSCSCCGRESETVHGYLYDESGTTTVYFAGYTYGHHERRANLLLSVGAWGEGTAPTDRIAIAMQVIRIATGWSSHFPQPKHRLGTGKKFLDRCEVPSRSPTSIGCSIENWPRSP